MPSLSMVILVIRVCFINRENLARLKHAAGRPQDLADLDSLTL